MKKYDPLSGLTVEISRVLTSPADISKIVDLEQLGQGHRTSRVLLGSASYGKEVVGFYAYYFSDEDGLYVGSFNPDENNRFDVSKFLAAPHTFLKLEEVLEEKDVCKIDERIATTIVRELIFGVDA